VVLSPLCYWSRSPPAELPWIRPDPLAPPPRASGCGSHHSWWRPRPRWLSDHLAVAPHLPQHARVEAKLRPALSPRRRRPSSPAMARPSYPAPAAALVVAASPSPAPVLPHASSRGPPFLPSPATWPDYSAPCRQPRRRRRPTLPGRRLRRGHHHLPRPRAAGSSSRPDSREKRDMVGPHSTVMCAIGSRQVWRHLHLSPVYLSYMEHFSFLSGGL
jgi:hypothetical protein